MHVVTLYSYIYAVYISRLQIGGAGENSVEFVSICVHVVVASPINSKPESQL